MTNAIIGPTSRIVISSINEGLIVMTNAMISPIATPMSVPAATPRQSIFSSLVVISTSQRYGKPYHILGELLSSTANHFFRFHKAHASQVKRQKFKLRH